MSVINLDSCDRDIKIVKMHNRKAIMLSVIDGKDPLCERGINHVMFSRKMIDFNHSIDTIIFSNQSADMLIWQRISFKGEENDFKTSRIESPHYVYQKNDDGYELKQKAVNTVANYEILDRLNSDLKLIQREFDFWKIVQHHKETPNLVNNFITDQDKARA